RRRARPGLWRRPVTRGVKGPIEVLPRPLTPTLTERLSVSGSNRPTVKGHAMSAHTTTPRNTSEQTRHVVGSPVARHAFALTRLSIGWIVLLAFLDKLLALGCSAPAEEAWLNGGSPTTGYLSSLDGVFAGLFDPMIGAVWADVLFMVGLGAIGAALMSGIGQRVATVTGVLLLMLMY